MSVRAVAATLIAALFWVPAAYASSLTNHDDKDWKVTIIEGKAAKTEVLKSSAVLRGICAKGCVVRLNDSQDDEYELKGSEAVSIEDGYLYYDGPPASAVPKADDADRPFEPGDK
jgi:hypothetical protein